MGFRELARAAQGELPCSLLLKNVKLLNVRTAEIMENTNVGVYGERVAYIGEEELPATSVHDCKGKYAIPGMIDTHLHIESSQVTPPGFADAVLPRGTTTVAPDPHEIVNVMGVEGFRLMLEASKNLPLKVLMMVPTCVPSVEGLETAGADLFAEDIEKMVRMEGVVALAEIMDYDGVVRNRDRMMDIIEVGRKYGVTLDGHCVFLTGKPLNAYISTGIEACHENFVPESAIAKLRAGMDYVKIRNLELMSRLAPDPTGYASAFAGALQNVPDKRSIIFCTDDIMPDVLLQRGHLDDVVRTVIASGYDPVAAIQGATINAATHLRQHDIGAVAPGKFADIILTNDLRKLDIDTVFTNGELVAKGGKMLRPSQKHAFPESSKRTVKLAVPKEADFHIRAPVENGRVKVRTIDMSSLLTTFAIEEVEVRDWIVQPDGLSTLAVMERHGRSGNKNLGLAKNCLERGAIGSTISHDSHNVTVMGRNARDMQLAVKTLIEGQGGVVVVDEGEVKANLKLPVAGLMSEEPIGVVAEGMRKVRAELKKLGRDEPWFLSVWAIAIPVAPSARITDKVLVDCSRTQEVVPLFVR